MRKLKRQESLSSQLAKIIERDIYSGKLEGGASLASARTLARGFDVSFQVVLSALDILEARDLIVRIPRKGVYIKSRNFTGDLREILFFALTRQGEHRPLIDAVNELLSAGQYDYTARIAVTTGEPERLRIELKRLENSGFVDCALVSTSYLTAENIRQVCGLPYPVILIGDLPAGDYAGLSFGAVSPDYPALAELVMDYAGQGGYRETVLFYAEQSARKDVVERMEQLGRTRQLKLRKIAIGGQSNEEIRHNFHVQMPMVAWYCSGKTLYITYGINSGAYEDRTLLPRERYPDIELMTMDSGIGITHVKADYSELKGCLNEMIAGVAGKSNYPLMRKVGLWAEVVKGD